ncbi:hypothetical protein BJX63DRAFT_393454 [Aspergillus granulosus]|uniref:Secreted protein n=1 Tax=Aspergillus granulosus TaxID=176169 RepID=A0ABR4HFE1_9EURO
MVRRPAANLRRLTRALRGSLVLRVDFSCILAPVVEGSGRQPAPCRSLSSRDGVSSFAWKNLASVEFGSGIAITRVAS